MKHKTARTKPLKERHWGELNFSQGKVHGFSLEVFQKKRIAAVGAGAIGSNALVGVVRKGVGALDIFDDDDVEARNLTRQLFTAKDIGKNKAICLASILAGHGYFKTTITGYPCRFQEAIEMGFDFRGYDILLCGVDNNPTRVAVAKYCLENRLPLVVSSVSRDGNIMCCAVQEPDEACFGCIQPHAVNDDRYPCNLPGIIDIIQLVSSFTVYAIDTVLMQRNREWNLRMISLDGFMPDTAKDVPKASDCKICGK